MKKYVSNTWHKGEISIVQSNEILALYDQLQIKNDATIHSVAKFDFPINGVLRNNEKCFYKVKQLAFDEDFPRREAFENVLLSMNNEAFNFVYILTGTDCYRCVPFLRKVPWKSWDSLWKVPWKSWEKSKKSLEKVVFYFYH